MKEAQTLSDGMLCICVVISPDKIKAYLVECVSIILCQINAGTPSSMHSSLSNWSLKCVYPIHYSMYVHCAITIVIDSYTIVQMYIELCSYICVAHVCMACCSL